MDRVITKIFLFLKQIKKIIKVLMPDFIWDWVKVFFTSIGGRRISFDKYLISKWSEEKEKLTQMLGAVYSLIDKGTKKKVFHKNTAARKKAKLSAYLKAA